MIRLVVTGAGGYLGGRLVASARGADFDVRAVLRSPRSWLEREAVTIASLEKDALRVTEGADAVVHLAGANEVVSQRDPDGSLASTVSAARAVAKACADNRVRRLVYVSTVHVYGAGLTPGAIVDESVVPQPRHPYAIARLTSEHAIAAYSGDTEVVVFRLTNGVGPPADPAVDRWSLVANDLCRQAVCDGVLRLLTSGEQFRDFVALDDVDRVILEAARGGVLPSGTYNLGSGRPTTIMHLAEMVAEQAATYGLGELAIEAPPPSGRDVAPYEVSVARLAAFGIIPCTPLADAIRETIAFCEKSRERLCRS